MWEDPIVAEVHRARENVAAQYNFDVAAFFADLRRRQAALGERLKPQKNLTEPRANSERDCHSRSADVPPSKRTPAS